MVGNFALGFSFLRVVNSFSSFYHYVHLFCFDTVLEIMCIYRNIKGHLSSPKQFIGIPAGYQTIPSTFAITMSLYFHKLFGIGRDFQRRFQIPTKDLISVHGYHQSLYKTRI